MAIGMIVVVMMVSGLRMMWRRDRPSRTAVSPKKRVLIVAPLLVRTDATVIASAAISAVVTDDGEEDVL
jgi:hypothetical protein